MRDNRVRLTQADYITLAVVLLAGLVSFVAVCKAVDTAWKLGAASALGS